MSGAVAERAEADPIASRLHTDVLKHGELAEVGAWADAVQALEAVPTSPPTADTYERLRALQPVLIALTVSIAAAFLVVSGPAVLRIHPLGIGLAVSAAIGLAAAALSWAVRARAPAEERAHVQLGVEHGSGTRTVSAVIHRTDGTEMTGNNLLDGAGDAAGEPPLSPPSSLAAIPPGSPFLNSTVARSDASSEASDPPPAREEAAEEAPFVPLLILSALTVAFAHGANDLGNSIGPLASVLAVVAGDDITAAPPIPLWVLALGSLGFVAGIALLGARTITTVGSKITTLTPSRSYAVQMGTAVAVLSSTVLGLAVSTSHCLVGSLIGVGLVGKLRRQSDGAELNVAMLTKIVIGWAATIPLAMLVSVLTFEMMLYAYEGDALCAASDAAGAEAVPGRVT